MRKTDHIHACLIAAVTLGLASGTSLAFFPTNFRTTITLGGHSHERITTDALEALDTELFGVQSPSGSMRAANESIVDGNIHVDDDQSHSALHFDGENFVAGQGRILGLKEAVIASIQGNDAQGAREELGQALHSIQDFYAHSNWTNNNGGTNPDLGVDGHQLQNTLGTNDPAEVNGVLTTGLTSGYYHGEDRVPATLTNGHKDRHGGPFDSLPILDFGLGLNRDSSDPAFSPQFGQHEAAASLAGDATKKYIHEIADQLTAQQLALLLGKGPTLGLVIDTTNSMGPIIAAVRTAAIQLVNDRLGTAEEPSQYVLGQINDPFTPAPVVTPSPDDFKSAIAALTTSAPGVDCPELAMAGMLAALGPMDPGGQLFVWTDASAKDSVRSGSVSALAQSKRIRVNFVLFGSCSPIDPGYIQIANETGGQVFFLTPQEVGQAANLPVLLVGTKAVTVLSVRDSVVSGSKSYPVPVDSTMTDVTFSADTKSMEVKRPNGDPVQAGDPDATTLALSGGTVVKVGSPAVGSWTVTIGVSSTYRLEVSGSSSLDMSRFRFVQAGGRDGHDGLLPIPGLPLGGAPGSADAVLAGSFTTAQFDLRRPNGDPIQDLSLAPLTEQVDEFAGTVTVPGEPFLPYVTGQDAGGNAFQRVVSKLIQPQSVSIVAPIRQDLHAGAPTTYAFTVRNLGDAGTFKLSATDDKAFIASANPSQADIPANGSAALTVVLQPPANTAAGTSDALTVRAESAGTPGLANFASLTSVVLQPEAASTTTSSTSTTSTTSQLPATTTIPSVSTTTAHASSSTTTTIPCTTPRCTIDAGLHGPECEGQSVPPAVLKKLDRATTLIDAASGSSPKKARHLLHKAKSLLRLAAKVAAKAARGKKPKLTKDCAAAIQQATGTVAGNLQP